MAETAAKPQESKSIAFKEKYTFEERLAEAKKKKDSNPRLLPLIVEKHHRSKLSQLDKAK